jgi:hypothetical protein
MRLSTVVRVLPSIRSQPPLKSIVLMLPPLEPKERSPVPAAMSQPPALKPSVLRSMLALTVTVPGVGVARKKAALGVVGSTLFDQATPFCSVVMLFQLRLARSQKVGLVASPPTHSKFSVAARATGAVCRANTPASAAAAADNSARFR